jgi:hypothetical protein
VLIVDLLFWYVTVGSLLTLAWSFSMLLWVGARASFRLLFVPSPQPNVHHGLQTTTVSQSATTAKIIALVDKRVGSWRERREIARAAAAAGPWGPINRALHPEISQKVERVMAVGAGMYDAAGKARPHPIAPRVALAIVEALQEKPPMLNDLERQRRLRSRADAVGRSRPPPVWR